MSVMKRSALVTGASSGIGLAIARTLAEEGLAVTMVARGADRLAKAADELRRAGHEITTFPADVTSEEEIQAVLADHRARHGALDVLVNNAGMGILGPIAEMTTQRMDLQYRINLRSIAIFYRDALDVLRAAAEAQGSAMVVNTASIAGKRGEEELSLYSAVKHGVVGFTQAMNRELHGERIKSCVLCPGYVDTPLSDYKKSAVPAETMIRSEDLAEGVRFLTRISRYCVIPEILFQRLGDPV